MFFALGYIPCTISSLSPVGQVPHNWSGDAVSYLACQQCGRGSWGVDHSLQEEEQVVEPAGSHKVIDEVADPIAQNPYLVEVVEPILALLVVLDQGCFGIVVVGEDAAVARLLRLHIK